jgi:outer membrane protein
MHGNNWINCKLKSAFYVVVISIGLVTVSPLAFAETLELDLEDAVALGLKYSLEVQNKQLALKVAQKDVKYAKAAYYPGIMASTGYTHSFDEDQKGTGVTAYYPDQLNLSLELSQTIYTFGRLNTSVQAAEKSKELAEIDLNEARRSLSVDIHRAFYSYLLARETLAVKEESFSYRKEALDNAKARYDAGLTTRREVLQAESELKSFVPELIAARNDIEYTILKLRNILGIGNEVDVVIKGELDVAKVLLDTERLMQKAFSKNSNIEQYEITIALQKIQTRLSEIERLPTISGFAGISLQNGFDIGGGAFVGDEWNSTISAGIQVQMELSSLFPWSENTADIEKNSIEVERMNTELEALRDELRLNIESVLLDISEERAKIEAGEKAMELTEELFLSSKEMYENGLISSMEYDDAQIALKDSRVSYLTYIYNYKMLLCDLMDAVGTDHI